MSIDWAKIATDYWKNVPHPQEPSLTIGNFATAVKLATKNKFKGHASPKEAGLFWQEFTSQNDRLVAQGKQPWTPEEYGQALDRVAPSSFAYHGRPPTMGEMTQLRDAHPKDVTAYYYHLPDKHYPTVPAGEMAKQLAAAKPHANEYIQRDPQKNEAAYLYASGQNPADYYQHLAQQNQQSQSPEVPSGVQAPAW